MHILPYWTYITYCSSTWGGVPAVGFWITKFFIFVLHSYLPVSFVLGSEVTPFPGIEIDEETIVSSTGALSLKKVQCIHWIYSQPEVFYIFPNSVAD